MSAITTHVLDVARGKPAEGVPVELERRSADGTWTRLGAGATDADGRMKTLLPAGAPLEPGTYAIRFDTGAYFTRLGVTDAFYPEARIVFTVRAGAGDHFHVPLLLAPFGYSTYRGS